MAPPVTFHLRDPFGNVVVLYARRHYCKATLDGPRGYVTATVRAHCPIGSAGHLVAVLYGGEGVNMDIQGPGDVVAEAIAAVWTRLAREIVLATR
jgi:hypothetical protein